jgi:hypothetical protein
MSIVKIPTAAEMERWPNAVRALLGCGAAFSVFLPLGEAAVAYGLADHSNVRTVDRDKCVR